MLTKSTRVPAATVAMALIAGIMVALWVALMPAPAKAQPGDVLKLQSIKCLKITGDEGGLVGDFIDEPYIKVDGVEVWSGRSDPLRMKEGDVRNLSGVSATLSGQSARVQLWESDPGFFNSPDDGPAEFFADYTGGNERTQTFALNGGVYEITYVVTRPPIVVNTPPEIVAPVKPAPGSRTRDRTPLISAVVRDAETDLNQSHISLAVDGAPKPFFSYNAATDTVTYQSGRLSYGRHTVTVRATDGQLNDEKNWSFKVVKKRR
jgi:hypothetical protein